MSSKHTSAAPLLAIVGRPNVGKSTLFNRLVGQRRSIVGDEPGITRDRIYGEFEWYGRHFRLVDTGGILPEDKDFIPAEIFRQAKVALEEAVAVIMVVDGRTELAAPDMELARLLIRTGKPLFLAVNKIDVPKLEVTIHEFRRLGIKNVYGVSAEHGTGVSELIEAVIEVVPGDADAAEAKAPRKGRPTKEELAAAAFPAPDHRAGHEVIAETRSEMPPQIKVAIIGRPNVGKSTLLNQLTGTQRAIVSPIAGTTRDAVDEVVIHDGHEYRFIDTAGIRRKGKTELMAEKLSVVMARKHLEDADVALMVIDATEGVTAADATIAGYAHESGRSVIIVVNKWDAVTGRRKDGKPAAKQSIFDEQVRDTLKFLSYAAVVFVSAIEGTNMDRIYRLLVRVAKERYKRVGTGEMNRFLDKVSFERAGLPAKMKFKIRYMTQAHVAPPTFILFTNREVPLHFSYQRFLENQIRDAFGFEGTPIWIKMRAKKEI